jgi:hypothetical protein
MKSLISSQRFLVIYSGVLTLVFGVSVTAGFMQLPKKTAFTEVDVQRINVVEPDGTLRMVISDKASLPGIVIKGKEHPHPNRSTAGILFFNDEGTENGGLTFGGSKDKNGQPSSFGHLSFDEYEQDQVLVIDAQQAGDKRGSALTIVDRPNYPIGELVELTDRIKNFTKEQQQAEITKFTQSHPSPHQRLYLGRSDDRSVALKFKDAEGHDRIVMQVAADGAASIKFLDQDGKIVSQLPAAAKDSPESK